ncbi:MAG: DNA-processing protein DprA [Bacteroidales bacterium]|nr:DNA-processing protein DprA [Bacteroidales bacterium]
MDLQKEESVYKLALNMIPGVGPVGARTILAACGSERDIFMNLDDMTAQGKINERITETIKSHNILDLAKQQVEVCIKHNIKAIHYQDNNYPRKLLATESAPNVIYMLGNANMDRSRTLGIVGTRSCDSDGKGNIFSLVEQLKENGINVIIISGLAAGADTFAHQAALRYELPTVGVLGHGLNMVYPAENRKLAGDIVHTNGALVTEYYYGQPVNKVNFPRRNRIIAGLCDALLVAQSKSSGGALITANVAIDFHREVFAFPGRISDKLYAGCNQLISDNKATLITSGEDLIKHMGWMRQQKNDAVQMQLNLDPLSDTEIKIIDVLHANGIMTIDSLAAQTGMPMFQLSSTLLDMEFKDLVAGLPGKRYEAK